MSNIELLASIATIAALIVAGWQLYLQRKEQAFNDRLNALIQIAGMLSSKIDRDERIIASLKARGEDWGPLAKKINNSVIPARTKVHASIYEMVQNHAVIDDPKVLESLLN